MGFQHIDIKAKRLDEINKITRSQELGPEILHSLVITVMKRNQHRDREGIVTKTGLKPGECDFVAVK